VHVDLGRDVRRDVEADVVALGDLDVPHAANRGALGERDLREPGGRAWESPRCP
jgi:hypothetical protein